MNSIPLESANLIADKALQKGRELKFAPLTVIVLDAGGQTKVLKREDNSSLLRPEIAMGKAWGLGGAGHGLWRSRAGAARGKDADIFHRVECDVGRPHGAASRRRADQES